MSTNFETPGQMKGILDTREHVLLSPLASFSDAAQRRRPDSVAEHSYRQAFSIDADRILNSLSYTRYIDKTQVFSLIKNDHLTHRVHHVQLVSRIARTIGRYLKLNEDLIEAASLGHDLGHPPFGHDGERILSKLCNEHGAGFFHHNSQSIQFLETIERNGLGWNLNLQTLDAILCHNGEIHVGRLSPAPQKSFEALDRERASMRNVSRPDPIPMTLEGCVVRMADTIAYLGRDMEDGLRLGLIERKEIPESCAAILGRTNGTIVFNLVTDLITNSMGNPFLKFSNEVSDALKVFKDFNFKAIYDNPIIKQHLKPVGQIYSYLFETYLGELHSDNIKSEVFLRYIKGMPETYLVSHSPAEIVRDFIAGMTDSFFIRQAPESMRPVPIEL